MLGWNISLYHAHANITPGPDANGLVVDGQGRATPQSAQRPPAGKSSPPHPILTCSIIT
jgi:hypothetical protein